MAKCARNGSIKAFSILSRYCRTLSVDFRAETFGLSEAETLVWTMASGYPHLLDFEVCNSQILAWPLMSDLSKGSPSDPNTSSITCNYLLESCKKNRLPRINSQDKGNKSIALIQIPSRGMEDVKSKITTEEVNMKFEGADGNSLLHYACLFGHTEMTLRLLNQGAKLFANKKGVTPLHWLSHFPSDSIEIVLTALLEKGANINAVSVGAGRSGLHPSEWFPPGTTLSWAVAAKRKDVISLLLSCHADSHLPSFKSALVLAANYRESDILELLLKDAPVAVQRTAEDGPASTLLEWAIESRPLEDRIVRHGKGYKTAADLTISILVQRRFGISDTVSSALRYSTTRVHSESNLDIIQSMLENSSAAPAVLELKDPVDGLMPIHCALAASGAMCRMLAQYGVGMNHAVGIRKYTWLHGCSRMDPDDAKYFARVLLEMYVAKKVNLEARDIDGYTPFMLTCRSQRIQLAKYLLSKGADPCATDNDGYTAVSSCLSKVAFSSLQEILASEDEQDFICHPGMGVTALHLVTEWDEVTDPEALIILGDILRAAPHLINKTTIVNGRTGLISAVRRGNMQMVKLLLDNGADLDVRDNNSMTAAELVWGMHLAYSESGQESKAARMGAIYTQLHGREHRRSDMSA